MKCNPNKGYTNDWMDFNQCSLIEQYSKVVEEMNEVRLSLQDVEDVDNILGECFDLIQATIGLMFKVADKGEIELAGAKHFIKLKERGWTNEGQIELHFK